MTSKPPKKMKDTAVVSLWKVALAHAAMLILGAFAFGVHSELTNAGKQLGSLDPVQAFLLPLMLLAFLPFGLGYAGYILFLALFAAAAYFRSPKQCASILALVAMLSLLSLRGCKNMAPIP